MIYDALEDIKSFLRGPTVRLLRDLRESTSVLILLAVTQAHHTRLRTLADELGMTVQGAHEYVRRMTRDGLLQVVEGEYRATRKGVELLQVRFLELKGFVDRVGRSLAVVETTAAFAGGSIRRGDRIGLFMERGGLVAYPNRASPSVGIAVRDAGKGEEVAVRDLEGIVALRPGRITIARVPAARDGGSWALHESAAKRLLARTRWAVLAALDVTGASAARRLGLRPRIEFGVIPAAIEAAERGVDILVMVPEDRAAEVAQAIEVANARLEDKIPYESLAL